MTRRLAFLLLCFAMLAVPAQGAAAAVMMVCSAAQAMADPSMLTRHASLKSEAELRIAAPAASRAACHEGAGTPAAPARERRASLATLYPELDAHGVAFAAAAAVAVSHVERDGGSHAISHAVHHAAPHGAQTAGQDAGHHEHHAGKHGADSHAGACAACAQCALGAMLMPQLPDILLAHHGHALPQTPLAAFIDFLPDADARPPTSRC